MLTEEGCRRRRARLFDSLSDDIEWALISDARHINYFSAFWIHPLSFSAGEGGFLLLERSGHSTLFADNFARRSAAAEPFVDDEVIHTWYDHQHAVRPRHQVLAHDLADEIGRRTRGRKGTLEESAVTMPAASSIRSMQVEADPTSDLGTLICQLRRHKEPDEIALLRKCMTAGEAGHAKAFDVIREGVTDFDVYREVQSASMQAAGEPVLVYGDFRATNAKTPKAGGLPVGEILRDGDLFILDFSAVINGYRSDFTNTIAVGTPTDAQLELFALCEAALQSGAESLTPGTTGREVHAAASKPFVDAGRDSIPHHAGHGIGLSHPEPPILVPNSEDKLRAGDVVTLEPGVYQAGIGGMRIERNYLITDSGSECLSNHRIALK